MILNLWELSENEFSQVAIIDYATSVIWAEPFQDIGRFELYVRATPDLVELFTDKEIFITRNDRKRGMYVETVHLSSDAENGDYLTISGRSAEVMMLWRVIERKNFSGASMTAEKIIRWCVESVLVSISSTLENDDYIPFLTIEEPHDWNDPATRQFTGKSLFAVVQDVCRAFGYGFRFAWTGNGFEFQLYKGTDRSFGQSVNSYVIFSPDFNNLTSSEYVKDSSNYYNSAIIGGQGEGADRVFAYAYATGKKGFDRRTIWVDARQLSMNTSEGELTPYEYRKLLQGQGNDKIAECKKTETFSGEVFTDISYEYRKDYFLGDKVAVRNAYGITGSAIVAEITEVEDSEGYRLVPTLSEWTITPTEEE